MTTIRQAQTDVKVFHLKHGFKTDLLRDNSRGWYETWLKTGVERFHMTTQELSELEEAWLEMNKLKIADALGDLLYVVLGTAVAAGIELEPIFDEVQRSNMTKNPRGDGGLHPKGENYEPPDLVPILVKQEII